MFARYRKAVGNSDLCYAKTYSSHNMNARMRTPYMIITHTLTFSGFSFQPAPTHNKLTLSNVCYE